MVPARQRNLEQWFCKIGEPPVLVSELLGLELCLPSLRNLPSWRFWTTRKEKAVATRWTVITANGPAGPRPEHLGFHNPRCMAASSLFRAQPLRNACLSTMPTRCDTWDKGSGWHLPLGSRTSQQAFRVSLGPAGTPLSSPVTMTKQFLSLRPRGQRGTISCLEGLVLGRL